MENQIVDTSFLKVSHLSKTYEKRDEPALKPVTFSLQQGEMLTILGESGSGKSTLLKLLAGLLDPDQGDVFLAGEQIKGPSHKLVPGYDRIKVVNQGFKLSPNMRVWENLRYNLLRTTQAYQTQRINELIDLCQLHGLAQSYPRELSGGQQQRVAIGRALANHPRLLLLDEPFSNLDAILKHQLLNQLTTIIKNSGTTAIFVMHDSYDALSISDRIGIIKAGELVQLDEPIHIYDQPKNAYVAQLFGTPNILSSEALTSLNAPERLQQSTLICIREEAITLNTQQNKNLISAKVLNKRFHGDYWKVHLKIGADLSIYANIPRSFALQVGQIINISIDWDLAHIFDNEVVAKK